MLFCIKMPRSLALGHLYGTMENSKLSFKYKTALFFIVPLMNCILEAEERGRGSQFIPVTRRFLCKPKASQGLAVASSGQPSEN